MKLGIFKGFLYRARAICTDNYVEEEIQFLIDVFVENGYDKKKVENIAKSPVIANKNKQRETGKFVSLPYIPGVSQKLKAEFSKAGLNTVFKSGTNLQTILTSRNKPTLPTNSYPGCYRVPCNCGGYYTGQTKKKASTRFEEHKKAIFTGNAKDSALSEHAIQCPNDVDWDNASTLSTEPFYFKRCVREALEIQKEKVGPRGDKIINRDEGLYVTTKSWLSLLQKIT